MKLHIHQEMVAIIQESVSQADMQATERLERDAEHASINARLTSSKHQHQLAHKAHKAAAHSNETLWKNHPGASSAHYHHVMAAYHDNQASGKPIPAHHNPETLNPHHARLYAAHTGHFTSANRNDPDHYED
jgi:hypothetical protein